MSFRCVNFKQCGNFTEEKDDVCSVCFDKAMEVFDHRDNFGTTLEEAMEVKGVSPELTEWILD